MECGINTVRRIAAAVQSYKQRALKIEGRRKAVMERATAEAKKAIEAERRQDWHSALVAYETAIAQFRMLINRFLDRAHRPDAQQAAFITQRVAGYASALRKYRLLFILPWHRGASLWRATSIRPTGARCPPHRRRCHPAMIDPFCGGDAARRRIHI